MSKQGTAIDGISNESEPLSVAIGQEWRAMTKLVLANYPGQRFDRPNLGRVWNQCEGLWAQFAHGDDVISMKPSVRFIFQPKLDMCWQMELGLIFGPLTKWVICVYLVLGSPPPSSWGWPGYCPVLVIQMHLIPISPARVFLGGRPKTYGF